MSETYYEEEVFRSRFNGKTLRRMFGLIWPYKKMVAGFVACVLVTSLADSSQFYINKLMIDNGILPGIWQEIIRLALFFCSVLIFQAFSVFGFIYLASRIGETIIYDLRKMMFSQLQGLSLSYYSVTPVGWIMSRVNSDTYRTADFITWGLIDTSMSASNIIMSMIFMLIINWRMGLIVMTILPVLMWIAWQFRKRILDAYRNVRRFNSRVTGAFNETISGVRVIKSMQREERNLEEFEGITRPMCAEAYRAVWLNALFLPCIQVLASAVVAAIIWYSGIQVELGLITIGGIQAFVNYVTSMLWPIQDLARVYGEMQQSVASAERIFSLMDAEPSITDKPDAKELTHINGDIVFDNVSFFYDDGDQKHVLSDFSLHIHPGETIALVGATGGGKTTIVNLLCRFYEPKQGHILIDGVDYTEYSMKSIQSHIGVVLQTPHLFSGTIRENLRYGRIDASDEEIEAAAIAAGADEFIKGFPNAYDEQVGEAGNRLSVGQKQLISLARAFLSDPDLVIMDEATSSVDTLTESLIQKGMDRVMHDRTSIVIAHRLSTINRADRILVIEDGRIAEVGTHQELLGKRGKYYTLYTLQFKRERLSQITM